MTYITIPSFNYNITFDIQLYSSENEICQPKISNSLHTHLIYIKEQIHNNNKDWDFYKKITNPYEYIHTPFNNNKNSSICKYKPLSRSFFKMIEIINIFNFLNNENNIVSFHLAEGPGGFIEAFKYYRNNEKDLYYGMTLISNNNNIPSWKKSNNFINSNKNIKIITGESKNGDLFLKENLLFINDKFKNSIDYITGDGGFDFSIDFNKQEELSLKLIVSQIFYAIIMQKKGGLFILKVFDMFNLKTIEMIFLLSNCYENVFSYKPNTSRIANSEKYIVCKNFKNNNFTTNLKDYIINNFDTILNNLNNIKTFFNIQLPILFLNKIEEINAIYGQQQLENINITLNLIREYNNLNLEIVLNQLDNLLTIDNITNNNLNENSQHEDLSLNSTSKPIDINKSNIIDVKFNTSPNNSYSYSISPKESFLLYKDIFDMSTNNKKTDFDKLQNKLLILKNINIQKCITWCNKYNLPVNKDIF
jgi:23S rRNA U2552 (ribose-2'-O)-methylase RlmE/FtsJ